MRASKSARDSFSGLKWFVVEATARRYKAEGITPESIESKERLFPTNWGEIVNRERDALEQRLESPEGHEAYRRLRMRRPELFKSRGSLPSQLGRLAEAHALAALWFYRGGLPSGKPGAPRKYDDDERLAIEAMIGLARVSAARREPGSNQPLIEYVTHLVRQHETEIAAQEGRPMISERKIGEKAREWVDTSYYLRKLQGHATATEWTAFIRWLSLPADADADPFGSAPE